MYIRAQSTPDPAIHPRFKYDVTGPTKKSVAAAEILTRWPDYFKEAAHINQTFLSGPVRKRLPDLNTDQNNDRVKEEG